MINLEKDYEKCEKIIKKASKTFYKAFSMLKDPFQRRAIYSVYAYCRHADDVIDEFHDIQALNKLKSELEKFITDKEAHDYIFRTLKDVASRFYPEDYDYQPYFDMLEGQYMDLNHQGFQSLDDLIIYCTKVASSVGEMLVPILAPEGDMYILKKVSYHLGLAMQITNILRDIGEDFRNHRIYIPRDIMKKHNYTQDDLSQSVNNEHFKRLFDELAQEALNHYQIASDHLHVFPDDARLPLTFALVLYKEIIFVCKENDYDVFKKRNSVSSSRKLKLIGEIINE